MQGKIINGFELKNRLGFGGMAEVWYAENKIGKKAAVKILLEKFCKDDIITKRFYVEAKIMVDLNHPNIRQVFDYGEIDNRPVIVMEYLDGYDLKERLKRGERFTDAELKKWWNQLISALNYTHSKNIIHRDIKPGNIFLDNEGNIKLLDFGIAKVRDSIVNTMTVGRLGTLLYMSPEQVKDSKHINCRTDYYSLAVTFVHLLTGKKPYDDNSTSDFEISEQIVYKPVDLSELSNDWRDFLRPYLDKDPNARPALKPFKDTKDDDDTCGGDKSGIGVKPVVGPNVPKPTPPNILLIVLCLLFVCLGVGGAWIISNKKNADAQAIIEARKQEEAAKITKLTDIYNKQVKECDFFLNNMVKDKNDNEADIHFIIEAFKSLQEIEKMETGSTFKTLNITPCYNDKYLIFRENLK